MKRTWKVADQVLEGNAEIVGNQIWIHRQGRTFVAPLREPRENRAGVSGSGNNLVKAPMPGKITKIFKTVGDQLKPGEVILIMEAMKMEYSLKAEIGGELEQLNCKLSDQVQLGEVLAKISAKAGDKEA